MAARWLTLTVIVFNDGYLNQIRMQQLRESGQQYGVALPVLDFAALAKAVGARYVAGGSLSAARIGEVVGASGVTLIEVPVNDSTAMRTAAVTSRLKALGRSAMGTHWQTVKGWLRS